MRFSGIGSQGEGNRGGTNKFEESQNQGRNEEGKVTKKGLKKKTAPGSDRNEM